MFSVDEIVAFILMGFLFIGTVGCIIFAIKIKCNPFKKSIEENESINYNKF